MKEDDKNYNILWKAVAEQHCNSKNSSMKAPHKNKQTLETIELWESS